MHTVSEQLVTIISALSSATLEVPYLALSVPLLELFRAILINFTYRSSLKDSHSQIGWGQGLLATIVMCAGGGATVSLALGEPIGILKSNQFWGVYGATHWLMFSNPYFYQFCTYLFSIPVMEQLFTSADAILRASAIVNVGINGVNNTLGQGKWVAQLLCGTMAGCGGALWVDAFRLNQQHWSFSTPRLLQTASVDMKASFLVSAFYLAASNPAVAELLWLPSLSQQEIQAWSAVILSTGLVYRSYMTRFSQPHEPKKSVGTPADEKVE